MKAQFLALGAAAVAAASFAMTTPAFAQDTHAGSGLPFCSKTVKDRCIQRADLHREGKSTAAKPAKAPAKK